MRATSGQKADSRSTCCRSARETSKTRPFKPSAAICKQALNSQTCCNSFVSAPVLPGLVAVGTRNAALMALHADLGSLGSSYQGLSNTTRGEAVWCLDLIPVLLCERVSSARKNIVLLSCSRGYAVSSQPTSAGDNTHAFFLPPFLPFEILLFLPTAMLGNRPSPHTQKRVYCKLGAWFNAPTAALGWGCPPTPTKSPSWPQSSTLQTFQPMSMSSNFNIER